METNVQAPIATTASESRGLTMPAWGFILLVIVGGTLAHTWMHYNAHGVINWVHVSLAFFLVLNILVNFWELGLFFTGDRIRQEYLETKQAYQSRPMERCNEIFKKRIPLHKLLSFKEWTGIWSAYCLFDPGYSRRGSFGYNIDVGNGFSTIIPATLFVFGMTFEIMPARWLGIIGVAMFWQMWYGTIVYFAQFFNAGRHKGHSARDLWLFVGGTNGMWFIFPLIGLWASVTMILNNSYGLFH